MGVGFARDGMNSLRANRSLKTSNKKKFKEGQNTFLKTGKPLNFKKVSKEKLDIIKEKIRADSKIENIRITIITLLTLSVIAGLIIYIFY